MEENKVLGDGLVHMQYTQDPRLYKMKRGRQRAVNELSEDEI
jgi:hypothetical protein